MNTIYNDYNQGNNTFEPLNYNSYIDENLFNNNNENLFENENIDYNYDDEYLNNNLNLFSGFKYYNINSNYVILINNVIMIENNENLILINNIDNTKIMLKSKFINNYEECYICNNKKKYRYFYGFCNHDQHFMCILCFLSIIKVNSINVNISCPICRSNIVV